jgi:PKD repeat protein
MHRLQLRDFGTYRTMVAAHTVDVGNGRAGIRWYELRESGGAWSLYQEGTFGPSDGEHRFMPSAAMNVAGDIGIGYLVSSTNTYVSTAVTGQSAGVSGSGLFDAAEEICAAGSGVQLETGRSGDYSSTSIDPTNNTFWHTNEVFTSTGQFQWATFVCEFSVGTGEPVNQPPNASFTYSCTDLTCSFTDTSTDNDGSIASQSWSFGDGATSTAQNPSHTYQTSGDYTVTLTVTDDGGLSDSAAQPVTVSDGTVNQPPAASFTFDCTDLDCSFDGSGSSDSDGSIVSYAWTFDDGATATGSTANHTYAAGGTYTVTLTVTDDGGLTGSQTQSVTVTEPVASDIVLSAVGRKVRGVRFVDLSWSGASGTNVDVFRDGAKITTTANDGAYTDESLGRLSGTFVYQVCGAGTSTCSNTASVTF